MNLKVELLFLILGALLRLLGTATSIWYFVTQPFQSIILYYLCGAFIVAPSIVFFLLTLCLVSKDLCQCDFSQTLFKLGIGTMITFGGPFGVPLFVYAGLLACNASNTGDFFIIEGLSRSTTLVEAMFESLPQIVIQVFNNQAVGKWEPLKYCSLGISTLGVIYCCYKLCHAIDKIKQYENVSGQNKVFDINSVQITDRRPDNDDQMEVYDLSP